MELEIDKIVVGTHRRSTDELKVLELANSIAEIGLLNPITVAPQNGGYRLIAGLHRLEAFKKLGRETIPASIIEGNELDLELAEIDENLKRAELTVLEQGELLLRRGEILKLRGERRTVGRYPNQPTVGELKTTGDIAAEVRLSASSVKNRMQIARNITSEVKEKILASRSELANSTTELLSLAKLSQEEQRSVVDVIIDGKARNIKDAQREVRRENTIAMSTDLPSSSDKYRLIEGDFAVVAQALESGTIDVIFTDPPYEKDALPLYKVLANEAVRLLKPGGSLILMIGGMFLPEVLALVTPKLKYQWTIAYLLPGVTCNVWARKIRQNWKPVVWFINGESSSDWVGDIIKSEAPDKNYHDFGQSESGMTALVERFSRSGDLVLDPFCGSGTTGVVAVKLGRRFIGIDIDPNAIAISKTRLADVIAKEA